MGSACKRLGVGKSDGDVLKQNPEISIQQKVKISPAVMIELVSYSRSKIAPTKKSEKRKVWD